MVRKYFFVFILLLFLSTFIAPKNVEAVSSFPSGFVSETVISNLTGPTTIAFAEDGRIFIGQKDGVVKVFENGTLLATPFIDLSSQVNNYWDRGLLGIALHPDFPETPYVYLLYTYDPPQVYGNGAGGRVARLMRVTADPNNTNVALAGSEVILLGTNSLYEYIGNSSSSGSNVLNPPSCELNGEYIQDCIAADSPSHTIGTVTFGTDGSLFVSSGDGAHFSAVDVRALRSLDIDSLNGKILRINPITGEGYPDNPFYDGDPNSNQSKVYSYGLRNPFRTTINPLTNELYIGDVGWNSWEEINFGRAENFGWPCYEGKNNGITSEQGTYKGNAATSATCSDLYAQGISAVQAPSYSYLHTGGSSSVQAGSFYVGSAYPSTYLNALFIADYNGDWIQYLTFDVNGVGTKYDFGTNVADISESSGIVQLISGPDTNLYYVAYNGPSANTSEVRRIRYIAGGNTPPTANASADVTSGYVPLTVNFSSAGSYDPDAENLSYTWDFGDGNTGSGESPSHTYTSGGNFTATLTVTDGSNDTGTDTVLITVGNLQPTVEITSPAHESTYSTGDTINFQGTGTDSEDGTLSGSNLQWNILYHHGAHVHFDFAPGLSGNNNSIDIPDHGDNTWIELCLVATDSGGLTDQDCISLLPNIVQVSFDTSPSGLNIWYDGVEYTTPFTANTIENSERGVYAPEEQDGCWGFNNWSNGLAPSHTIETGTQNASYTATYTSTCPIVLSITRANPNPSPFSTVNFTVTFSENVTGVNASDFSLSTTNISGTSISQVTGSGNTYNVSVNTGSGNGYVQLNLVDNDSIKDTQNNPLGSVGVNNGDFTNGQVFSIIKTVPSATTSLISPNANIRINTQTPEFIWKEIPSAVGYEIQIATNTTFTNIIYSGYELDTAFIPTIPLTDGTYFWRVRGFNGRFTPSRRLFIDTTPPLAPSLTSPMNAANLRQSPILRWASVSGAVLYEIQIDTDINFGSPDLLTFTSRSSSYRLAAVSDGIYYWRVMAKDAAGNWGTFSTHRIFTIQ